VRQRLASAAKDYDWTRVIAVLSENPELVNTTRPGGSSLYAPLHQAAHGGAPAEIVHKLIGFGAWLNLQNARGERPLDIAERRGHSHLLGILAPDLKRHVPLGILLKMQAHFHAVIRARAEREVRENLLRLPELEPLLEFDDLLNHARSENFKHG
jgi:ankyrin repeat protein